MNEYMEFRLACQELITMGYALGFNYNPKEGDWRAIAAYPGAGVKPWTARKESMEKALMNVHEQIKTGVRA